MEHVSELLKTALNEIERVLSSKTVVGEPIQVEDHTLIPLISIGFGFGAGGGSGKVPGKEKADGLGAGTGGGGGIRPLAIIIVSKDGVRIEPIKGAASTIMDKFGDVVGKAVDSVSKKGGKPESESS